MITWTDIEAQIVHMAVGFIFGGLVLAPLAALFKRELRQLWEAHERTQRQIADSLDPEKPGGVTEQLDQLQLSQANRDVLRRSHRVGGQ